MSQKPPPYGKETLCPLLPGPGRRRVPCERTSCSWWEDGCCSLVPVAVGLAREIEDRLRGRYGRGG